MIFLERGSKIMTRSDAELLNLQFHRQTVPPVWSSGEGVWLINEDGDR